MQLDTLYPGEVCAQHTLMMSEIASNPAVRDAMRISAGHALICMSAFYILHPDDADALYRQTLPTLVGTPVRYTFERLHAALRQCRQELMPRLPANPTREQVLALVTCYPDLRRRSH